MTEAEMKILAMQKDIIARLERIEAKIRERELTPPFKEYWGQVQYGTVTNERVEIFERADTAEPRVVEG